MSPGKDSPSPGGSPLSAQDVQLDEADALQKALKKLCQVRAREDTDELRKEQLAREKFLREFPQVQRELEEHIRELRALADKVEKVHRKCTIYSMAASSTGVLSGVLTFSGLALAPVTAGISLGLMAAGTGLGTVATASSLTISAVELFEMLSAESRASQTMPTDSGKGEEVVKALMKNKGALISILTNCVTASQTIRKNIKAIKLAQKNPKLAANAKVFTAGGNLSVKETLEVQKAFKDTVLSMTKRARMVGMATTGLSLAGNAYSLWSDSKHLREGAKAELAEELRLKAELMEKELEGLTLIYESLQGQGQRKPQP
ncbi:PREDICTED: apolipoprotein L2-like [Elephantulus edwardii]|uniref:apolipoprotein L2-like n=1 Tax=Elephantulus edwardii TaxID=28737 RepID=UPI0003F0D9DE|nr:PREDICTED: apolipoprotein L2-like [Elephantulus edwardii]